MDLNDNITVLKGLGSKSAEKFNTLGIFSIEDLLLYFPFRYDNFKSRIIEELVDGEKAVITGIVLTPPSVQYYGFKKNRLHFKLRQGEAVIAINFFNQPFLQDKIVVGKTTAIFGKWNQLKSSLTGMKLLPQVDDELQPVYHVTKGVSQHQLIKVIKIAFESGYGQLIKENLPESLLNRYRLLPRQAAIMAMHFPRDIEEYKQALRRIKFEELLYFQLQLQVLKKENKLATNGLSLPINKEKINKKIKELPFQLTKAQDRVLTDILTDMTSGAHMNRLLQGDVGSGKTVIAGLAMYAAYTAGFQSAMMVPTEILAEQHFQSLSQLFPKNKIALLISGMTVSGKKATLKAIASGSVDMIVGTHALIQEGVNYQKLGLVITDEQHRFGVNQRRLFREKGNNPDVLMMTATPIPRTLAITAFGEMDASIIDELPTGRKKIITRWVKHEQFSSVLIWLEKEIAKEAQIYIVSPLIEESEALDLKNAVNLYEELNHYFADKARVALLHGKMKTNEKEAIMHSFKNHEIDILVSTTVIEVGVNISNATIMIIMDADRFGLSQLHQLRGRVGRGEKQSYAILVSNPKTQHGKKRMTLMTETTDGFVLAEEDLKMRGAGEIFGTRQSGLPEFKTADIVEDYHILEEARHVAQTIVSKNNWEESSDWALLAINLKPQKTFD
ncbi:ATP-dependent DNA helicase RecG [Streptococcus marimammalium]|uniref:ATP-dependent DNA helicase RecG n=1 Tax=Streptococcus marimammalium TaxID=269666 RepID=UPI00038120D0|nr:ATP-dependent DNA helicase RecG [Streptococcus marimammalium]